MPTTQEKKKKSNKNLIIIWAVILVFLWIAYILPDPNLVDTTIEKQDFSVQTESLSDFNTEIYVTKPWVLSSDKEISVLSKAAGKISAINSKEWDYVTVWSPVVVMSDSNNQYYNNVKKLENSIESAQLQYEQSVITFDKNIHDAQIALDQAEDNLEQYKKTMQVQLQELENSQTSQAWDNSLIISFISQYNSLNTFLNSTLLELDVIFWVSTLNEKENDDFEYLLSARNLSYYWEEKSLIKVLFSYQSTLSTYNTNRETLTYQEIQSYLSEMKAIYSTLEETLETARLAFVNTLSDSTRLPQSQLDWYISMTEQLKTTRNTLDSSFDQYENQFNSSISVDEEWNYTNIWDESVNLNYEKAIIDMQTQLTSLERNVEMAEANLENLKKQRDNSLEMSQNSITDIRLSYQDAVTNASNLTSYPPINWNIWLIYVQEWQDVSIGTTLFTVMDQDRSKISVWVNSTEHTITQVWDQVDVIYKWRTIPWTIDSVSPVALAWGQYTVIVKVSDDIDLVWDVASVIMYWNWEYKNIPLSVVKVLDNNEWYLYVYNPNTNDVDITPVQFWKVWWENIELLTPLPEDTQIITNPNIEDYNNTIHNIVIQEKE